MRFMQLLSIGVLCTLLAPVSLAYDLSASNSLTAAPGETVTVTVSMSDIATNPPGPVLSLDMTLSYNPTEMTLVADRLGSFFPVSPAPILVVNYADPAPGDVSVTIALTGAVGVNLVEEGEILELDFTIAPGAADGLLAIDLKTANINEIEADNLVDGEITVTTPVAESLYRSNVPMIIQVCAAIGCP